jgi:glutaredoxin-related protein
MYVLIGKEKCNRCEISKNLLDEKGIQYHYVDVNNMPHNAITYFKMYCPSYPMVLGVKYSSTSNETLEYVNDI